MMKYYQEMQMLSAQNEEGSVILQVMQRAKKFDLPLFQNESIATMLLSRKQYESIPPQLIDSLKVAFNWMAEVEKKAQVS